MRGEVPVRPRYYVYASAAKVRMLYPQIESPGLSVAEFGLKVLSFGANAKVQTVTDGESFYRQLATVERWILENEPVGSIEDPSTWIYGREELLAANFLASSHPESVDDLLEGGVLFTPAQESDDVELLMGGSGRHLTINPRLYDRSDASRMRGSLYFSWAVSLMNLLDEYRDEIGKKFNWHRGSMPAEESAALISHTASSLRNGQWNRQFIGPCEFLAKRLRTVNYEGRVITLATPLFIAQVD